MELKKGPRRFAIILGSGAERKLAESQKVIVEPPSAREISLVLMAKGLSREATFKKSSKKGSLASRIRSMLLG